MDIILDPILMLMMESLLTIYLFHRTTNYGLKQLKVNGPRIWNELPS